MSWSAEQISLEDDTRFETVNGLWTGKKPPFIKAGVIRNTNFTESGRVDYSDVAWLEVEQKQLAKRQLQPGDIIVERSGGGPKQPVGRVVYFAREDGPFSFSNFTTAIRVRDTEAFDSKFVFYRLLELYQSGRTEDIQRRTTGIRNLDFTAYKERATFPRISIGEQRKIASVLGLVQRAMEQQERLLAVTAELKKALLHQLFTNGLRREPQKQTELGLVPESWEITPLGKYCSVQSGFAFKSNDYVSSDSGIPIIKIGDLQNGDVVLSDRSSFVPSSFWEEKFARNFRLGRGDLLIALTGATTGKTAEFRMKGKALLNQRVGRFLPDGVQLRPAFLKNLILQPYFQREIQRNISRGCAGKCESKED